MTMTQDLKLRWLKTLLPFCVICQCGKKPVADYQLDPGRFLHLTAWCDDCERLAFEDTVSDKMIPFKDTRYDYTVRRCEATPASIAIPGLQCEKCSSEASGTFNVIKEVAVPWEKGWGDRAFEFVSGPHHRCERHLMRVSENVIPLEQKRKQSGLHRLLFRGAQS
jgi:hypothetical protein